MRTIRGVLLALACAAASCAIAACGGGDAADSAPAEDAAGAPAIPTPPPPSRITMTPRQGAPGSEVTLVMSGLMMSQPTDVGFGTFAGHEIIDTTSASASGDLSVVVRVPASSAAGTYYFFVAERNGSPIAVSDSFVVTGAP
jgi:hypothetical protein